MTITPDQARELLDGATPGPWWIHPAYGTVEPDVISGEGCRFVATDEDLNLSAKAPGMAQTIAGMTEEWGVKLPATGKIMWRSDLKDARELAELGNGLLVRRLVSDPEVIDGE